MKKTSDKKRIIILTAIIAALFLGSMAITAVATNVKYKRMAEKRANEKFTELDYYSMNSYCEKNAAAVFKALKMEDSAKLSALLINTNGLDRVMAFADWKKADFDKAISMGSGSLSPEPDNKGRIDVSERFFVDVGDSRYMFFIETLTSRWGRENEGVSAIAVTTFEHFDATDYEWNGERDDESELAGELFWERQDASE